MISDAAGVDPGEGALLAAEAEDSSAELGGLSSGITTRRPMDVINLQLPPASINTLIDGHVKAAVIEAMATKGDALIKALVYNVLWAKTGSYGDTRVIDQLCGDFIKDQVKDAMKVWLAANEEVIRKEIERLLKEQKKGIPALVAQAFGASIKEKFGMSVSITMTNRD